MKIHKIFSGFALAVLLALGMVGGTQTAYAEDDYTCIEGGNPPPADGLDGVNIIQNGTSPDVCTLGNVHVKHFLGIADFKTIVTGNLTSDDDKVYINGGVQSNVTTGALSAGTDIRIGGAVKLGSVTAGTTGVGTVSLSGGNAPLVAGAVSNSNGWVYITSQSTIKIPSIITTSGDVRVFSNLDQTAGVSQKIGTGGIGSVKIDSGSGNSIYVSNTAGIDYSGDNILNANISSNPGGFVVLDTGAVTDNQNGFENANTGIVTIAGSLNVDGSGGNPAGFINIFASEIIAKGATISASSVNGQVGTINLVTNKISNRSGLTINVNGNNSTQTIDLSIFPIGSFSMYRPVPLLPIFFSDFTTSTNPLDIVGDGTLAINADGNNNGIKIFGYPLKISPGTTTISNKGSGNLVTIQGTDGGSQLNKINWGGPVQIHANNTAATGQTANLIEVKATNIAPLTDNVLLDASGGDANANGSNINLTTNGGTLSLGGSGSNMTLNANGGTLGGDSGNVTIDGGSTKYTTVNADAITASAKAGNGKGGNITLTAKDTITIDGTTSGPLVAAIKANGTGSGKGGKIVLQSTADVVTEGSIEANGGCDSGDGGEITLTGEDVKTFGESSASGGDVSFCLAIAASPNSASASLTPGSANGGKKIINANNRWLVGPLTALHYDGKGDGNGGEIIINNPNHPVDLSTLPDGSLTAKAGPNGTGVGGKITIASARGVQGSPIDVNRLIIVDGGSEIDFVNNSFGKISLNGVSCEQWKTGFQNAGDAFPQTVWNCVDGQRATVMPVALAANTFEAGPRHRLTNAPRHHIYVMSIINSYQTFFARPQNNRKGSYGITPDTIPVSVAFVNVYDKQGNQRGSVEYSGSNTILAATIVHESGHKLDLRWGSPSATPAFSNLRALDYHYMDVDPATGIARPCADVFDATSPFCTNPTNAGLTNSQIFEKEYPAVVGDDNELFALILEHVKSAQPGSGYSADPWLEAPLRFFPQMSAFIQGLLNQP